MAEGVFLVIQSLHIPSGPTGTSKTLTHGVLIAFPAKAVCSTYLPVKLLRLSWDEPMLKYLRR